MSYLPVFIVLKISVAKRSLFSCFSLLCGQTGKQYVDDVWQRRVSHESHHRVNVRASRTVLLILVPKANVVFAPFFSFLILRLINTANANAQVDVL